MSPRRKPPCLHPILELSLGQRIGQLRAVPACLGPDEPPAVLAAYCADFDVDPYVEMFFFPTDTLKLALFTCEGQILWQRDLGRAVVPGLWFCPVLAFDLDGDGTDEVWFVNNLNEQHPLGLSGYRLERLDARTGRTTGQWLWHIGAAEQSLRNFILGGHAKGEPVLVTAQGTYGPMFLQGWWPDMALRWQAEIPTGVPGARGSHMCPVTDVDGDGVEEILWGERCVELGGGREVFCADREGYRGHSDVIQPVLDRRNGRWFLFTCRESHGDAAPRVALYDHRGGRVWGDLNHGHMDMGWVARLGEGGRQVGMATRIGKKACGPDGRFHEEVEQFTYDVLTGHELVRGAPGGNGEVLDRTGKVIGNVGGAVAMACKFMDLPGEQLLSYHSDGMTRIWADRNAADSHDAQRRYGHPFYQTNCRLSATGYNLCVLGGL